MSGQVKRYSTASPDLPSVCVAASDYDALVRRLHNLQALQQAGLERSGRIKAAAGALGWTAESEDSPLEFLIEQAQRCRQLEHRVGVSALDLENSSARREQAERQRDILRDERDSLKFALDEWFDKTAWVQQAISKAALSIRYLGMHRADVMSAEIERLRHALYRIAMRTEAFVTAGTGASEDSVLVIASIARSALEASQ